MFTDKVVIVGSGPSARGYAPPDGTTVIAVNGAVDWLSRVDIFFTLDPSPENMSRMYSRRKGVLYYCANEGSQTTLPKGVMQLNRISSRGREPFEKGSPEWWLWRWSAVLGLSEDSRTIHSGNSAYGALGLAYHLGATKVLLVGVDATQEKKIDGKIPNNLSHLPLLFASTTKQIDFVSIGQMSVNHMEREEGESWLLQ